MCFFYLTLIYLICLVFYYIIYQNNINNDLLFTAIVNFIFITILPIYYFHFKDINYSFIISILLWLSSLEFNINIKNYTHNIEIYPFIYYLLTCLILGFMISKFLIAL